MVSDEFREISSQIVRSKWELLRIDEARRHNNFASDEEWEAVKHEYEDLYNPGAL